MIFKNKNIDFKIHLPMSPGVWVLYLEEATAYTYGLKTT